MKPILLAVALIAALASCKKPEPCYSCQWVRSGKIQPGSEERCGLDVPDWANKVRIGNPQYYPVCSRIK